MCVCLCQSVWLRCTEEALQLLYHLKPLCVLVCSLWPIMISVTICESIMTVSQTKRDDKHLPYNIISSHHNYFLFSSTICWCSSAVCQKSLKSFEKRYDVPRHHINLQYVRFRAGTTHRRNWRNRRHKFVDMNNLRWRVVPNRKW